MIAIDLWRSSRQPSSVRKFAGSIALVFVLLAGTTLSADPLPAPKRIQKIMAKADGLTPQTAFKESRVKDQYEIVAVLGLKVESQSFIAENRKYYDRITATNGEGTKRELWFDISRFYGTYQ